MSIDGVGENNVLNIQYESASKPTDEQAAYSNYYFAIGQNNFSDLFLECSAYGPHSFSLPVQSGDKLAFYLWYSVGSEYQPIYNSTLFVTGLFSLTPEPATLLLLGLGGMVIRKAKK